MMKVNNTIKRAMEILKSVKKPNTYVTIMTWEVNNGYDADLDLKMRAYFKEVNTIADEELRKAMADIWNATIEFYYTEPLEEPKQYTEDQINIKTLIANNIEINYKSCVRVATNKGARLMITWADGRRKLLTLWEPESKSLNFDACEKELCDLHALGTKDYRSALAALVAKYNRA